MQWPEVAVDERGWSWEMKVDVEGAEMGVLRSGVRNGSCPLLHVNRLVVETEPGTHNEVMGWLRQHVVSIEEEWALSAVADEGLAEAAVPRHLVFLERE